MTLARRTALTSAFLALASLPIDAGCERRTGVPPPVEPSTAEPRAVEPSAAAARAGEPATPGTAPQPVEVEVPTEDGVLLHATLYPGATRDAPAVVLAHQVGSSRAEWAPLVEALREPPALTVLALDLRGHGASTQSGRGPISYADFDTDAWALTAVDVTTAVFFLSNADAPVRPSRIAAVGSSMGATAVIRAGVNVVSLSPLVLLSPGRAYHGVDGILPAIDLGPRALLAVAAREELDSVETAAALARITHGRVELVDGAAHGVALFAARESLVGEVASFLREQLSLERVQAPSAEQGEVVTP
jgi:pimeloyl-ACP methyl ester carboxylesterase